MTQLSLRQAFRFERLAFVGSVAGGHQIDIDSLSGAGRGGSPMELLLISLAGCGMDVVSLLRKQRQPVEGLDVHVHDGCADHAPGSIYDRPDRVCGAWLRDRAGGRGARSAARALLPRSGPCWASRSRILPSYRVVNGELELAPLD